VITLDNNRDDVIVTRGGNDRVDTDGGKDLVCAGTGADEVDGAHKIHGGRGQDDLDGFRSKVVFGAEGDDNVRGSRGRVMGGKGDDRVRGNQFYVETLIGGPGADEIVAVSSFLEELEQFDLVDYSSSDEGVTVDLQAGTVTGDGHDTLTDVTDVGGSPFKDRMRGADEVGEGDDILLMGRKGPDILRAGDAPTDFDGGSGDDRLIGGASDDFFEDDKGSDYMDGGGDIDMVWYGNSPRGINLDLDAQEASGQGSDRILQISEVVGSEFSDVIKGDDQDNYLDGDQLRQTHDDVIVGRGGEDLLIGNLRSDDKVYGGPDTDTFVPGFIADDLVVDLETGTFEGPHTNTRIFGIENVNAAGAGKNLVVKGDDGPNRLIGAFQDRSRLVGRGGDDFLKGGTDHRDVGRGGGGTDTCEDIENTESCEVITP
jgi:RTX calcium-binding nonapeptide repeat (4 copies)